MPLSINVGLSRKASKDYQSTGVSINVTAELDQALLAKPQELQRQVADLYAQAEQALDRQAGAPAPQPQAQHLATHNAGRTRNGNGHANGDSGRAGAPMTVSQRRAITAIASRVGVDPAREAQEVIGAALEELTLRQASELIDHLKAIQPAGRNGGGR